MPLPVSAQTYIPNPQAAFPTPGQSFEIGKQTNPIANIIQGAISGYGTGLEWQNTRQQMQQRKQQMEWYPKIQEREQQRVEALEERNRIAEEARQSNEAWRRTTAERAQQYREDSLRLREREVNARITAQNEQIAKRELQDADRALKRREAEDNARYSGLVSTALRGDPGGSDALYAAMQDPKTTVGLFSWLAKNSKFAKELAKTAENELLDPNKILSEEEISNRKVFLEMNKQLPGITTMAEQLPISTSTIGNLTGFTWQPETKKLSIRNDQNGDRWLVEEKRDGKTQDHPISIGINTKSDADLKKAITQANQAQFIQDRKAAEAAAKTSAIQTQTETPQQETPVKMQREQVSTSASRPSLTATPQPTMAPTPTPTPAPRKQVLNLPVLEAIETKKAINEAKKNKSKQQAGELEKLIGEAFPAQMREEMGIQR